MGPSLHATAICGRSPSSRPPSVVKNQPVWEGNALSKSTHAALAVLALLAFALLLAAGCGNKAAQKSNAPPPDFVGSHKALKKLPGRPGAAAMQQRQQQFMQQHNLSPEELRRIREGEAPPPSGAQSTPPPGAPAGQGGTGG